MMKVTYILHSGFSVELETCVLLFDYYRGELPRWEQDKPIYVFVSHKHQDHFNLAVFDLIGHYDSVHIFLGSDIRLSPQYLQRNGVDPSALNHVTHLGKRQELRYGGVEIRTLRSTDAGVAFLVETQGRSLYHAGDLNWWHWEGEPAPFNENMEKNYKKEIDSISGMVFDVAFVPLDPRLEKGYDLGINYFLERTEPKVVFPMHMWEEYTWIRKYKKTEIGRLFADRIYEIEGPGQEFILWNM